MDGFVLIPLKKMLDAIGEDETFSVLSDFLCPKNNDIETFIKRSAVPFEKQGIARTQLVFSQYCGSPVMIAYYTIASKVIEIDAKSKKKISKSLQKRFNKYGTWDPITERYIVSAPLIAQLGKNFANGYDKLITGDELLKMACETVRQGQMLLGGRFVYLECEDNECLTKFYVDNGFVNFGKRQLDRAETDELGTSYLMQMLKYL